MPSTGTDSAPNTTTVTSSDAAGRAVIDRHHALPHAGRAGVATAAARPQPSAVDPVTEQRQHGRQDGH